MPYGYDDEFDLFGGVSPEVQSIQQDYGLDPETLDVANQVARMQSDIAQAGLDPKLAEPRPNLILRALDTLAYPLHGTYGVLDAAISGDIGSEEVGTGWQRGVDEKLFGSELLRKHDVIDNPIARGIVGFGLDMLVDPLTWLSFGTGTAAKIGGKTLTEGGEALHALGVQRLADQGVVNALDQSKALEEVFRAIDIGQDAFKRMDKAGSSTVMAAEAKRFADAEDLYSSLFKTSEVVSEDIFKTPKLRIEKGLPFIGHLTGEAVPLEKAVLEDSGPIGQAIQAAGWLFSPGKIKAAEIDLPENVINAFSKIKDAANTQLANFGGLLAKTPILGQPTAEVAKGIKGAYSSLSNELKAIFNRKAVIGVGSAHATEDFINAKAAASHMATDKVVDMLGVEHLTNPDALKDSYLLIDSLAKDSVLKGSLDKDRTFDLLKRMAYGQEASDGDLAALRNVFQTPLDETGASPELFFRSGLEKALANPDIRPEVKDITQRILRGMDEMSIQEAEKGINHGFLEYYVTHKYMDAERNPFAKAGASGEANFSKARKYETVADAFEQGGKIADMDIPNLLRWRVQKSITLQAQQDYARRLMIENSLPQQIVTSLYKEAAMDPNGPAAKALARNHFTPPSLNWQGVKDTAMAAERQKTFTKALMGDEEASKLLTQNLAEFENTVHRTMWENGVPPLDKNLPSGLLGEVGGTIKSPAGEEIFLPKAVADAYKETVASRDYFKEAVGGSAIGRAIVGALDTSNNIMRKWMTVPWPSFWVRNVLGERFQQAMGGLEAVNPGIMARTHALLNGETAIRNKAGQLLDTPTLKRIIRENGLNYNVSEHIGTIQSFADMNMDKFLKTKKGMLENLVSSDKGSRAALLTQVHDKFEKSFHGFFRVNQLIHRFEQGDSIGDAVRNANNMYFNYRNMTGVERSFFRRFYMFYGFMNNATRATMTDLVTKPGNIMMQLHGSRAMAEFFSDPDAAPTAEQLDYRLLNASSTQDQLSYPIGRGKGGKQTFASGFAPPVEQLLQSFAIKAPRNMSVGEMAGAVVDSGKRTLQKQFAASNPIINAAAQALTGKNLYFDKPLDSAFLRKIPDLTEAAEKISGYAHTDIPSDINDVAKKFLNFVPDGKGRGTIDPAKMWILVNLVPGMSRAMSIGGTFANADVPTKAALLRSLAGIRIADNDVSRSYLSDQKEALGDFTKSHDVKRRLDLLNSWPDDQ